MYYLSWKYFIPLHAVLVALNINSGPNWFKSE